MKTKIFYQHYNYNEYKNVIIIVNKIIMVKKILMGYIISGAAFVSSSFVARHDFQLIRLGRFRTRGSANTSLQPILQPIKAFNMSLIGF